MISYSMKYPGYYMDIISSKKLAEKNPYIYDYINEQLVPLTKMDQANFNPHGVRISKFC